MHDSSFYDRFRIELASSRIYTLKDKKENSQILNQLSVSVSVELSVVPTDPSICRVKARCVIEAINILITNSSIMTLGYIMKTWKQKLKESNLDYSIDTPSFHGSLFTLREELQKEIEDDDPTSELDENEFLDALDSPEEEENPIPYLDGDWMADAESFVSTGGRSKILPKRRAARSISDISSISELSLKGQKKEGAYLNAENLARLEERDDSDESKSDSDDDSFHSAISLGGHEDLLVALQQDIELAQSEIKDLEGEQGVVAAFSLFQKFKIHMLSSSNTPNAMKEGRGLPKTATPYFGLFEKNGKTYCVDVNVRVASARLRLHDGEFLIGAFILRMGVQIL